MVTVQTEVLDISVALGGPEDGDPVLLLHGWPDAARAWAPLLPTLHGAGLRTVVPDLRGHGGTRFRDPYRIRDGRGVALATDALQLMDALGIGGFAVVGHDWGARAGYQIAALAPERIVSLAALALPYQPNGTFSMPSFPQSRAFWYQWLMSLDAGAEAVRADPLGFARIQWDTWSPPGWFDDQEFAETAAAFDHPDWAAVTLSGYRTRFMPDEPIDPAYREASARIEATGHLAVPTLMIQGGDDRCDLPDPSDDQGLWFDADHRRIVLDGVGHFPHREAPDTVGELVLRHLIRHG